MENVGANKVKLEITVSPEDFAAALQEAYLKNRGKYSVQGFRKGKAPRSFIENYYGEGIFFEDAFDAVFPDSYTKTVDELKLEPVSRPDLDIVTIGKKEGVVYTAEVFIKPEVVLGEYKGVKAEEAKAQVDDKQVDDEIKRVAERNVRWVDVDREAKIGDKVIVDYSGSVDGEKFDGGTAENQPLELGSNTFIPGFEEQVAGMKKGEEKDITVKFPDAYQAELLAGKEAVFAIKLHEVKEKEMPVLNDEFAQDVSEFDTLEEYKESIKKRLTEQAEAQAKSETENNVVGEVVKNAKIDLPLCMIENQIDNQIRQIEYNLMYQGIKLDDYLKMTGTKMEDVRNDYRESAEKAVRTQLVIEAVKDAEGIEATKEQIEDAIKSGAERAKKDMEEYRTALSEDELAYIKENLAYDNTVAFLVQNAVLEAAEKKNKKDKAEKENTKEE
ncbi:MAG: trigger factor [Eubacteriales bacterium]|nr:trigger factor [Eubacteriales bacterium]